MEAPSLLAITYTPCIGGIVVMSYSLSKYLVERAGMAQYCPGVVEPLLPKVLSFSFCPFHWFQEPELKI